MAGDVNSDGRIDNLDVDSLTQQILNGTTSGGTSDCNADSQVNVHDVVCVLNKGATAGTGTVTSYSYDGNGNMLTGSGRVITYDSANMPETISRNGHNVSIFYSPERARYKKVVTIPQGQSETTLYVGKVFEKRMKPSGVTEYVHYISAGSRMVAITRNGVRLV